ncbi:MAG: hypothetical protein ACKO2C_02160 [Actinomycetes bacterium]
MRTMHPSSSTRGAIAGDGEPSDTAPATTGRPAHPSVPGFTSGEAAVDDGPLAPAIQAINSGASGRTPVELLEAQLATAMDQLSVARERLVRSRHRVAQLQQVVGQLEHFVSTAHRHRRYGAA